MYKITCLMLALILCGIVVGQKAVSKEMQNLVAAGIDFHQTTFLKFETSDLHSRDLNLQGLSAGAILNLDVNAIQHLFQEQQDFISLSVPITSRTNMVLTLKRHEIFTPDFKLFTSSDPTNPIEYEPGLHYMGVVDGDPNSIVGLSVFRDQVMAMIATDEGNFVIGQLKDKIDNKHIFYNDRDLDVDFPFECGTEDDGLAYTEEQLSAAPNSRDENDCVRIHIEVNDDIVTAKGGVIPATDYITGLFNQCFVLYANDELTLLMSEMKVWTTESPYTGSSSGAMLSSYKANTEYFNGDLSQLVSFDSIFGGTSGTSGLCNNLPDASKCFSGIRYTYKLLPLYSTSVYLVTHEMGHLFGSRHTHACVWNGNGTAIDGCPGFVQGSCPIPPIPPAGGTIMSYCNQTNSGSYIDFNHGFGEQPGNLIRNGVYAAGNCLSPCDIQTEYCAANGANSSTEFIDKIILNTISNPSGNNGGYEDYTSITTTLIAGNTYTIALTPKFTGGNKTKSWRVWMDFNHDFDWVDSGEMVAQGSGSNTLNLTFTIPSSIQAVTTRMRVAMKYTGFPGTCNTFPTGEVEDYTITIQPLTPACDDGILNQGEEDIDCGGPCSACPPPPDCMDGIQNQNETGIDCGGECPACPEGDSTILLASYFETGMDSWIDGGPDVARVSGSNAWEGQYSIALADNSGAQSAMTSPVFNLSDAVGLQINFHFKAVSMETGEDFWVQYKNGSGNWTTIGSFISGSSFNNNSHYFVSLAVPNFVPTSAGSLRIQCDASDNNDQVFIDAVIITKLNGTELMEQGMAIQQIPNSGVIPAQDARAEKELVVYPNPVSDLLNVSFEGDIQSIRIISLDGRMVNVKETNPSSAIIDISSFANGIYFLFVQSEGEWYPAKFSKM